MADRQKDKPQFWAEVWQAAQGGVDRPERRRTEKEIIENWSRRAGSFARHTRGGHRRRREILKLLEGEGALKPGIRILDIGAGPGNFTIPLAKVAAQVTALEPAEEMLKILRENVAEEGLTNVSYLPLAWQDVDLEQEGLERQFDLVFASMTPGIQDARTLEKMMAASRGYCYYSGFAGPHYSKAQTDLLERFLGREALQKGSGGNILYPFLYLYAKGYRPNLRFSTHNSILESSVPEAVEELEGYLWHYLDITPEIQKEIEAYVRERAVDGVFRTEREVTQGLMIWQV